MTPIIAALLFCALTLAGQTKTAAANPPPSGGSSQGSSSQRSGSRGSSAQGFSAQEDKATEAAIRAKLAKSKIGKDGFTVRVQGGVATWEGATGVVQHKGAATRMAKTAGAKRVINNIKISDDAKQQAAGNLEQGRRRAQVKRSEPR